MKTSSGFEYELNAGVANDIELLEDIAAWDKGDLMHVPSALSRLLGAEQKKALYEHLRGDDGIVPTDKVMKEVIEMLQGTEETKNS